MRRFAKFGDGTKYGKRHKLGVMNRTESRYAEALQIRKLAGEVIEWHFEPIKFRLSDNCFYSPDFMVHRADGVVEFVDVKGGGPIDDKSIVKIKVAAEKFFEFLFVMEKEQPKKIGGGWKRTEF